MSKSMSKTKGEPKLLRFVFRKINANGVSVGYITRIIAKDKKEGREILRGMMDRWEESDKRWKYEIVG